MIPVMVNSDRYSQTKTWLLVTQRPMQFYSVSKWEVFWVFFFKYLEYCPFSHCSHLKMHLSNISNDLQDLTRMGHPGTT